MDKLSFKSFVWPRNPEYYRQEFSREPEYMEDADGSSKLVGVGPLRLVISGSGTFTGDTAHEDFRALAELCGSDEAGKLIHPIWGETTAYLAKLEMSQEPRADYVAYSFTFQAGDDYGNILD